MSIFKETQERFFNNPVAKILKTRDSDHLIAGNVKEPDSFYPETGKISYDNYIVGF